MVYPTQRCETCTYWRSSDGPYNPGHCRRHSPAVDPSDKQNGTSTSGTLWPATRGRDWCGDWEQSLCSTEMDR